MTFSNMNAVLRNHTAHYQSIDAEVIRHRLAMAPSFPDEYGLVYCNQYACQVILAVAVGETTAMKYVVWIFIPSSTGNVDSGSVKLYMFAGKIRYAIR